MSETTRFERVQALALALSPYRISPRVIRGVLAVVPVPRARYRRKMEHALAAIVVLPFATPRSTPGASA